MSAVRLASAVWRGDGKTEISDMFPPKKTVFQTLVRKHGKFIEDGFLPLISDNGGGITIEDYFDKIHEMIRYRGCEDIGIPKQLFPLLGRELVQVLLRLAQIGYLDDCNDNYKREDILRLVLFWIVAVDDKAKASIKAYETIKSNLESNYPFGKRIYLDLNRTTDNIVYEIYRPTQLEECGSLVYSKNTGHHEDAVRVRGVSRFKDNGQESKIMRFYQYKWWQSWTHVHPILLWLQREMVARDFDKRTDPMAGQDYDTPYDYDHILPQVHWSDWRGETGTAKLPIFCEDGAYNVIGNSIGNIRIWDGPENRSDGDASPSVKLHLNEDGETWRKKFSDSLINPDDEQKRSWKDASRDGDQKRVWSGERASAFQRAVEGRAFYLYNQYFNDLKFDAWLSDA